MKYETVKVNKIYIINNKKYVKVNELGIHPLMLLTESYTSTSFKGEKETYVELDEAIRIFKSFLNDFDKNNKYHDIITKNISFIEELKMKDFK